MDIQLSAAAIDITPGMPLPLFGFAERKGVYSKVQDRLEINLMALKQGAQLALVYSVDTLFVPDEFVQLVLEHFGEQYGLVEKDVWIVASHTHFAPSLDRDKPKLGAPDEKYISWVKEQLLKLTTQVLSAGFEKVNIQYGNSHSQLNVNRRKKLIRPKGKFSLYNKVLMYPNYQGPKDDNIHLLKLLDNDGNVKMALWNYACHPVGYPHLSRVTAEYVGMMRQELRNHFNNQQLPVVFLIGFAGNLKPDLTPVTHTRWKDILGYIFQLGPKFIRFPNTANYRAWNELLWKEVKQALGDCKPSKTSALMTTQYDLPLSEIIGDSNHKVHFKKMQLTDDVQLIGISAEVLTEYSAIINELFNSPHAINIGCLAGTKIYLPTDKQVKEGGYEVHGFRHKFGIEGSFKHRLAEKIKNAVSRL